MTTNGQLQPRKSRFMNCRAIGNNAYVPTKIEHVANVVTHGISVAPSIYGLQFMLAQASTSLETITVLIYGFALIALFTISTVFHSVFYLEKSSKLKNILHRSDRAVIYLFIAASYTPWLTLKEIEQSFHTRHTWWIVWLFAFFGIGYQHVFHERYKGLETLFYALLALLPSYSMFHLHECSGLNELAIGGCVYMIGVYFFKSDGRIPCAHAIWHLFVSIGASIHFYAVCKHLLGKQNGNHIQILSR